MNSVTIAVMIARRGAGQCAVHIAREGAGDDIIEQLGDSTQQAVTQFVAGLVRAQGGEFSQRVEASAAQAQPIDGPLQPPCFGAFVTDVANDYRASAAAARARGAHDRADLMSAAIDVLLERAIEFQKRSAAWRAGQQQKGGG